MFSAASTPRNDTEQNSCATPATIKKGIQKKQLLVSTLIVRTIRRGSARIATSKISTTRDRPNKPQNRLPRPRKAHSEHRATESCRFLCNHNIIIVPSERIDHAWIKIPLKGILSDGFDELTETIKGWKNY